MAEKPMVPAKESRPARGWARGLSTTLGLVVIGLWVAWWVASVGRDTLVFGQWTWVPALPFLAGDYKVSIDHVARIKASGIDPYYNLGDWVCGMYQYPPMIARVFAWVAYFDVPTSIRIWIGAMGLILAASGFAAWRTRVALGLGAIPMTVIVGAFLVSTPVVNVMERGQSDPLILLPFLVAAWLLARRGPWSEIVAGGLLGATAWLKYYPGVSLIALVVLGRRKATMGFVAVAALIGIVDFDGIAQAIRHGTQVASILKSDRPAIFHPAQHWIVAAWNSNPIVRGAWPLRAIPPTVAEVLLLLPAIVLVSRRVARSSNPDPLVWPYLLWLTAATTYALPGSNDYNLFVLPLAALAVWDRRDSWRVHASLGLLLIWWQPFQVPISGQILMVIKLAALYAVGASLAARADQAEARPSEEEAIGLFRPTFARVQNRRLATGPILDVPG